MNGYLVSCFDKDSFANSIYKVLFLNELIDKENKQEMLKERYNPLTEAKSIIQRASKDLKKN